MEMSTKLTLKKINHGKLKPLVQFASRSRCVTFDDAVVKTSESTPV